MGEGLKGLLMDQEQRFLCEKCNLLQPDDQCFGVVQIDDNHENAELWCFNCAEKHAFIDDFGIWRKKFAIDKKKSTNA